ncbi:hypothetical protein HDU76_006043, partial [Blyttiomyces sp. JEL0837]
MNPPPPPPTDHLPSISKRIVTSEDEPRLHKYIRQKFPVLIPSKSQSHDAFKKQQVLVNGKSEAEGYRLVPGDIVEIKRNVKEVLERRDMGVFVKILYEDSHLAIVFKPAGVTLHNQSQRTLELSLPYHLSPSTEPTTDHLDSPKCITSITLLDKATSGLVLVAKTKTVWKYYMECEEKEEKGEEVERVYRAVVHGRVGGDEGLSEGDEFAIEADVMGIPATSKFRIVSYTPTRNTPDGWLTTLDAIPISGFKLKQIRCHLFGIDHPVIGNSRHTKQHRTCRDKGLFLSLIGITLKHPVTGDIVSVTHPDPSKYEALRLKEAKFFLRKEEAEERMLKEGTNVEEKDGEGDGVESDDGEGDNVGGEVGGKVEAKFKNAAYVVGSQTFFNRPFKVTPAVMIPRQSTETLVNVSLKHLQSLSPSSPTKFHIMDMGTGSGCILISIMKEIISQNQSNSITGIGLDISKDALDIAEENIKLHELSSHNQVQLLQGSFDTVQQDLSTLIKSHRDFFPLHLITCNPPYLSLRHKKVTTIESTRLMEEPFVALFGDVHEESSGNGFDAYVKIRKGLWEGSSGDLEAMGVLERGCLLVVEIGHGMGGKVRRVLEGVGDGGTGSGWEFVEIVRDFRKLE